MELPVNELVTVEKKEVTIDEILENENRQNKKETWNKLNKTMKIQKLHYFAEKYGKEHKYSMKEVKDLKHFFNESLDKKKLQRAKEVGYDKTTQEIIDIPGLFFHATSKTFTLRTDPKHESTLKSLTPKRVSEKQRVGTE